jgi:hypothetical protein
MVDEVNTQTQQQPYAAALGPNPSQFGQVAKPAEPVKAEPKAPKVDHLTEIAELARNLHNVSPSGAETVRDKILQHIAWAQDPKSYDEHVAREKKAHDEAAAASKKAKEAAKAEKAA